MAYLDDKILACAGNNLSHTCFNYDPIMDTWSVISNSSYGHEYMPGVVSDNKIYLADDTNPESKKECWLFKNLLSCLAYSTFCWFDFWCVLGTHAHVYKSVCWKTY